MGWALLSLLFPGFAHGLANARISAIAFAASTLVLGLAFVVVSPWCLWLLMLVAVVAAADGYRVLRRMGGLPKNKPLAVLAIVICGMSRGQVMLETSAYRIPSTSMAPTFLIGDHIAIDKLSLRWRAIGPGDVVAFLHPCEREKTYVKRVVAMAGDTVEIRCSVLYVNGKPAPSTLVSERTSYPEQEEMGGTITPRDVSSYRETLGGRTYLTFHDAERPAWARQVDAGTARPGEGAFPRDFPASRLAPACVRGGNEAGRIEESSTPGPCGLSMHYVVPAHSLFMLGDNRDNSNDSRFWGAVPESQVLGRVANVWWPLGRTGVVP